MPQLHPGSGACTGFVRGWNFHRLNAKCAKQTATHQKGPAHPLRPETQEEKERAAKAFRDAIDESIDRTAAVKAAQRAELLRAGKSSITAALGTIEVPENV